MLKKLKNKELATFGDAMECYEAHDVPTKFETWKFSIFLQSLPGILRSQRM